MGNSGSRGLEDELFNLKFAAKQLVRESQKTEKEMHKEKDKVKKAMESGRMEIAQIHASNAIMHKNNAVNYLRMSSRIDAVAGKLNAAIKMNKVTGSMAQVSLATVFQCRQSALCQHDTTQTCRSLRATSSAPQSGLSLAGIQTAESGLATLMIFVCADHKNDGESAADDGPGEDSTHHGQVRAGWLVRVLCLVVERKGVADQICPNLTMRTRTGV
eukprot:1330912-Rhodomonas_salina.2